VDDVLVATPKVKSDETIVELMNGCICCTVLGDLSVVVKKILGRGVKLDGIIIETTGMANPAPVVQTFFADPEIADECRIDTVITVGRSLF
jgi:G3E family GTPase